jgi:HK97 family phage prohead protease
MTTVTRSTPTPGLLHLGGAARSNGAADPTPNGRTMYGHFAVFNRWAEIDSWQEGHFLERFAVGAFAATIAHDRQQIKSLFQHGRDPQAGLKPLGPITVLREDGVGAYYEVQLLDAGYVDEIVPALRAGLLGASMRFQVVLDEVNQRPPASAWNPQQLPERTIREAVLREFGPVSFPAHVGASRAR